MLRKSAHKISQQRLESRTKRHNVSAEFGRAVMAKKKAANVPPKLTEAEQHLIWHMEHGYQLETDSLGGNPVLHRLKDDEALRPASANRNTVKALEERGLISPGRGRDPLTMAWRLNSAKAEPKKAKRR